MNIGTIEREKSVTQIIAQDSQIDKLCKTLARKDFVFMPSEDTQSLLTEMDGASLVDLSAFKNSWNELEADTYMGDGGQYRKRRHATLSALPSSRIFKTEPHQPHYQSLSYNTLNGGLARHYAPIEKSILNGATMTAVIRLGCEIFGRLAPYYPWHIEIHQFRIEAQAGGIGKPTPEGVHRDGVNFVMMLMVKRQNLVNGGTTIYDLDKMRVDDFTLQHPLDMAIVNDEHVFYGVTPIAQLDSQATATRDVLVITFRRKL
ncbi:MAG: 2OG-Fe dioxygenase family protein [Rhodoferax sp.]|uniref:2OG-Fe dioxygenase family protein n=1 Tax=Rhodoferax sp. TaxID=50421 RepID=UPI003BB50076|nr:2OG-Fe dioxygenase family protein [Rhodoferax sp.]